MDGRLRIWLTGVLVAATLPAVGCKMFQSTPPTPGPVVPAGGQQKGGLSGLLQAGHKEPSQFRPTETPTAPQQPRKKGQPFKPETDIAVAEVELEAAFDENRTGADRDRLIDVARMRYQEALKKEPKNKKALLGLARVYTWAKEKERAESTYALALKHHPKDAEVAFAMMKSCVGFEDWDGACKACEKAIALDPENRTFRKSYGSVLAMAQRYPEAYEALQKVMTKSEIHTHLGRLLIDNGNIPEGQRQMQIAVREDPQNETAQRVLTELAEYHQQTGGQR